MAQNPYQSPRAAAQQLNVPSRVRTRWRTAIVIGIVVSLFILSAVAIATRMFDDIYFHGHYFILGPAHR